MSHLQTRIKHIEDDIQRDARLDELQKLNEEYDQKIEFYNELKGKVSNEIMRIYREKLRSYDRL